MAFWRYGFGVSARSKPGVPTVRGSRPGRLRPSQPAAPQPPPPVPRTSNLHASLISGGTGESTIPDRCVFTVERRTLPGETLEHVEADIADLIERCRPTWPRRAYGNGPHGGCRSEWRGS